MSKSLSRGTFCLSRFNLHRLANLASRKFYRTLYEIEPREMVLSRKTNTSEKERSRGLAVYGGCATIGFRNSKSKTKKPKLQAKS